MLKTSSSKTQTQAAPVATDFPVTAGDLIVAIENGETAKSIKALIETLSQRNYIRRPAPVDADGRQRRRHGGQPASRRHS